MGVTVDGSLGKKISEEVESLARDESRKAAERARERANEKLMQRASSEGWDNMGAVADSATIYWNNGSWVVEWTYETDGGQRVAPIFEYGTTPYEIGSPVEIEPGKWRYIDVHPGFPAVGFMRAGRQAGLEEVDGQ